MYYLLIHLFISIEETFVVRVHTNCITTVTISTPREKLVISMHVNSDMCHSRITIYMLMLANLVIKRLFKLCGCRTAKI